MVGFALGTFDSHKGVLIAGSPHRDQQFELPTLMRTARRTAAPHFG
ncbi:hypothetical protein IQ22_03828 [Pseudomonas duriflava]|uniref:Uncharacterized protein n=1 Tax=Pseudomonas duriflava TaxID=459528 RepID=A0A562Q1C0_9PSED|nr:hypothetical protein IQ22_03828 [Pseudomonas duriflava]